ncbi:MAG: hypothetical protein H6734_20105 [Alphaproteobacteria bacterium]|nr:hypothetical protein [Alphaproteobacteria bacterium]
MRAALLLLAACGPMESPLSVVDDLRVVDMVVDPASPAPGEVLAVQPVVLDGSGTGFETFVWWCVEDACGTDPVAPAPFVTVSALACAPGVCDGPPGDLANPEAWLAGLPFEGVGLTQRRLPVSPSAEARINVAPAWTDLPALPASVGVGEEVQIALSGADDQPLTAWLYVTAGSVPSASVELEAGEGEITWVAPDAAGVVSGVVILDDGAGGTAEASWTVDVR